MKHKLSKTAACEQTSTSLSWQNSLENMLDSSMVDPPNASCDASKTEEQAYQQSNFSRNNIDHIRTSFGYTRPMPVFCERSSNRLQRSTPSSSGSTQFTFENHYRLAVVRHSHGIPCSSAMWMLGGSTSDFSITYFPSTPFVFTTMAHVSEGLLL